MRNCTFCGESKPLDRFDVADRKSGRLRGDCKDCVWQKQKARYSSDPEKWAEIRLTANRKHKYGVSREDVLTMLHRQDYSCAICGDVIDYMSGCLDHCHETTNVRGLLCKSCNYGLGAFRDNIGRLQAAIAYLERV